MQFHHPRPVRPTGYPITILETTAANTRPEAMAASAAIQRHQQASGQGGLR